DIERLIRSIDRLFENKSRQPGIPDKSSAGAHHPLETAVEQTGLAPAPIVARERALGPSGNGASISKADDGPIYVNKASGRGPTWRLCLKPNALEWSNGHEENRIFYHQIARVRLSQRGKKQRRYFTEISSHQGRRLSIASVSWHNGRREHMDSAYGAFIRD